MNSRFKGLGLLCFLRDMTYGEAVSSTRAVMTHTAHTREERQTCHRGRTRPTTSARETSLPTGAWRRNSSTRSQLRAGSSTAHFSFLSPTPKPRTPRSAQRRSGVVFVFKKINLFLNYMSGKYILTIDKNISKKCCVSF